MMSNESSLPSLANSLRSNGLLLSATSTVLPSAGYATPSTTFHVVPLNFTLPLADPLSETVVEEVGVVPGASETTGGASAPASSGSSFAAFASALAPAPGFTAGFGLGFGIGSLRTRSSRGSTTSR